MKLYRLLIVSLLVIAPRLYAPASIGPANTPARNVGRESAAQSTTITIPHNLVARADTIFTVSTNLEQSIENLITNGFEDQEKQATVRQWLNQSLRPSMDKAKIIATLHNIRGQDDALFNQIFA